MRCRASHKKHEDPGLLEWAPCAGPLWPTPRSRIMLRQDARSDKANVFRRARKVIPPAGPGIWLDFIVMERREQEKCRAARNEDAAWAPRMRSNAGMPESGTLHGKPASWPRNTKWKNSRNRLVDLPPCGYRAFSDSRDGLPPSHRIEESSIQRSTHVLCHRPPGP